MSTATLPAWATLLGEEHSVFSLLIRSNVAEWHMSLGRVDAAIDQLAAVVARMSDLFGPFALYVMEARARLASMRATAGDVAAAVEELSVLSDGAATIAGEREAMTLRNQLALTLLDAGQAREAVGHFEALVEAAQEHLGADADRTWTLRNNLGMALARAGQSAEAIDVLVDVVANHTKALGPRHPDTLVARHNLAGARCDQGQFEQAAGELYALVDDRTATHGQTHPQTLDARMWLAKARSKLGEHTWAIQELAKLIDDHAAALGRDHPQTLSARSNLAVALLRADRRDEAVAIDRELALDRRRVLGEHHPLTLLTRRHLVRSLIAAGQREEAHDALSGLLEDHLAVFGSDSPETQEVVRWVDDAREGDDPTITAGEEPKPAATPPDEPLEILRHLPRVERAQSAEALMAALTELENAVERQTTDVPAPVWHRLGTGWERLAEWDRAGRAYERALAQQPNPATYANLCHVRLNQRRWGDAVSAGERALELGDEAVRVVSGTDSAFAALQLGNPEAAVTALEAALDAGATPRQIVHVEAPLMAMTDDPVGAAVRWEVVERWAVHADRLRHPSPHGLDVAYARLALLHAAGRRASVLAPLMRLDDHHPWSAASLVRWFALETRLLGTGLRLLGRLQDQSVQLTDEHSAEHRLTGMPDLDDFPAGLFETQRLERCADMRSEGLGAEDRASGLRALLRLGRVDEVTDWLHREQPSPMKSGVSLLGEHAALVLDEAVHAGAPWAAGMARTILDPSLAITLSRPTRHALTDIARGDEVREPERPELLLTLVMDLPHITTRLLDRTGLDDPAQDMALRATASSRAMYRVDRRVLLPPGDGITEDTWHVTLSGLGHAIDLSDPPVWSEISDENAALWWAELMYRAQRDDEGDEYLGRALSLADDDRTYRAGRNDPCPCGSGNKFKRCHGS